MSWSRESDRARDALQQIESDILNKVAKSTEITTDDRCRLRDARQMLQMETALEDDHLFGFDVILRVSLTTSKTQPPRITTHTTEVVDQCVDHENDDEWYPVMPRTLSEIARGLVFRVEIDDG